MELIDREWRDDMSNSSSLFYSGMSQIINIFYIMIEQNEYLSTYLNPDKTNTSIGQAKN